MSTQTKNQNAECCPKVDPKTWEEKTFQWNNKKFIKDHVFTFFFIPLNFGSVMKRVMGTVEKNGGTVPDSLCLSDHTSKWNMDIYLAVDKDVPGVENVTLSGTYYSKVYEGDFKDTGRWCKDFESRTKEKGLDIKKWYMWYTTCPKCAKKWGKNYVVIIGKVE